MKRLLALCLIFTVCAAVAFSLTSCELVYKAEDYVGDNVWGLEFTSNENGVCYVTGISKPRKK